MSKTLKIKVPGFPDQSEKHIEFPNVGECLLYPMFVFAPAEDVYKYGSYFQKYLLDKAPLKNDKKHVLISSKTRMFYPGVNIHQPEFSSQNEWHIDGLFGSNRTHIISSICSARTEFNTNPFEIECTKEEIDQAGGGYAWIRKESVRKSEEWGVKGRKITPEHFTTFTNHMHRAPQPDTPEIRTFFRVVETDDWPKEGSQNLFLQSAVYVGDKKVNSVDIRKQGVYISFPNEDQQLRDKFNLGKLRKHEG